MEFKLSQIKVGEEADVWLDLNNVDTGRINLRFLLSEEGALRIVCVCGRDLFATERFAVKTREFQMVSTNVRDAWENATIPDQDELPSHPDRAVCQRLLNDGFCIYGDRCQFDHPAHIARKNKPPSRDRQLIIVQGEWGFLRDRRTVDVTDMLKDIVIEQEGIQLELPKTMKHLLWQTRLPPPAEATTDERGGLIGDAASSAGKGAAEPKESEGEDGGEGEEGEEDDDGGRLDLDAPLITVWERLWTKLTCRQPRYGLRISYMLKGETLETKTWCAS